MWLEIRHLRLIQEVAQQGTLTKAGSLLHLTESALSHQLRAIEEQLGTTVFFRLKKKMVLTPAGERLLSSARAVLDELETATREIRQMSDGRGILRLTTECNTCYHWLPALLKTFSKRYPQVDVEIDLEATRHPIARLLEGKLDLAVVASQVGNQNLLVKPLFKDEIVVIMKPDHLLARRRYVQATDFAPETLIYYAAKEDSLVCEKVLAPAGVVPRKYLNVQLTEAIIEMVKAGLGISAMPRWVVQPQIRSGALCALPLTREGFYREWSAVMIASKAPPKYLLEFIDLLASSSTPARQDGNRGRRDQDAKGRTRLEGRNQSGLRAP
jgi:LysR family transcriptional regulator, regulator for metE and metH